MTRRWWLLYAGLCAFGIGAAYAPTFASGFQRFQGVAADSFFFNYILEHQFRQLTGASSVGTFWSPAFFHPITGTLAYSESLIGTLPIYASLRLLLPPTTAFQVWAMAMHTANFFAMLWLLRRLDARPLLAASAAFIFAFGFARVGHLYQEHLFPHAWLPLAFAAVIGFVQRPNWRDVSVLAVACLGQTLCSLHLGWFLGFGVAAWLVVWLALDGGARDRVFAWAWGRGRWLGVATIAGAAFAIVLVTLGPYLEGFRTHGSRDDGSLWIFGPRWQSWLTAPRGSIYAAINPGIDPDIAFFRHEHELFPGAVPLALALIALVALWRQRRALPRASIAVSAVAAALVLVTLSIYVPRPVPKTAPPRERGWSLWWTVVDTVPGARGMRANGRIWTAVHPLLIVGGIVGLEELLRRRAAQRRLTIALAALAVVAVGEQLVWKQMSFDKPAALDQIARMRRAIPDGCQTVYFTLPPQERHEYGQVRAMWAAMDAGIATVNGYSSYYPPGLPPPQRTATRQEIGRWLLTPYGALPFCYVDRW